jgi:chloride channel 7
MSGSETAIKQLLHSPVDFGVGFLLLFGVYHYFMACFTFGLAIPGGVFVPTILAGCAMGRIVGEIVDPLMEVDAVNSGTYALMGAAAMMGGVTRMTVSLAVILIEVTGNVQYALPLMLVLMSSKFTGDLIIDGLYDVHIELRRWAFLEVCVPELYCVAKQHPTMLTFINSL